MTQDTARVRWAAPGLRSDYDPSTGRYEVRLPWDEFWWPERDSFMRVTVGDDAGSVSPVWRPAGRLRWRIP